uniref:Secreted protein n=1 Tax=Aegilops tauschii subsp. strangulata TaxID=200361 RepID=A0A452ZEG5_AEGTS
MLLLLVVCVCVFRACWPPSSGCRGLVACVVCLCRVNSVVSLLRVRYGELEVLVAGLQYGWLIVSSHSL